MTPKRRLLLELAGAAILLALIIHGQCSSPAPTPPARFGMGPMSAQGGAVQTDFAGVVDPTNPKWDGGGLVSCASGCSSTLTDNNRRSMQDAINAAAANNYEVYVPPSPAGSAYPISLKSGQSYAIDLNGKNGVHIVAYNAEFRLTGDQASSAGALFWIRNSTHDLIEGAIFSARDATNTTTATNMFKIGDGGSTNVDDVQLVDNVFTEGVGGDCILMDGGTSTSTVTRVTVTRHSRFEGCAQSGIHIKPGVARTIISQNFFKNSAGREIWMESPADGPLGQSTITINTFEHSASASTPISVELAGYGSTNSLEMSQFTYNTIVGGVLKGTNLGHINISANPDIEYNSDGGATALIDLSGKVYDVWVRQNMLNRGVSATNGSCIRAASDGVNAPSSVWIGENRCKQYSGAAAAIDVTGGQRLKIVDNDITYHGATADSGSTGFVGIYCTGNVGVCSGVFERNRIKRDIQNDGVTAAGRMLAGIELLKGGGTTVGSVVLRDNNIDGAASAYYIDADGAAQWPEGYPLLSGSIELNVAAEFAGGITTWVPELTPMGETIASGALGASKAGSVITTANTVPYTLADGPSDNWWHCIKIKSVTGTPAGTLTPAHFADGTTHTLTWSAAGGSACLAWDATAGTYRLQTISATGMTLN